MYAIRSYYGPLDLPARQTALRDESRDRDDDRITSYNVCYTKLLRFTKPTLELLAGVPTVVYGFFAALAVAPVIRSIGESLGLRITSYNVCYTKLLRYRRMSRSL